MSFSLCCSYAPASPGAPACFGKSQTPPQWGLDAAKTHTPDYAKDAAAVILYDEYVETIDAQGRAVEREREAIRILKPQGRGNTCEVSYNEDRKDQLLPRLDHRRRRKAIPGPGLRLHRRGRHRHPHHALHTQGAHRSSSRGRCGRHHHLRVRRGHRSPTFRRRSGNSRTAFPSSFRLSKSTLPPGRAHPGLAQLQARHRLSK